MYEDFNYIFVFNDLQVIGWPVFARHLNTGLFMVKYPYCRLFPWHWGYILHLGTFNLKKKVNIEKFDLKPADDMDIFKPMSSLKT